MLTALSAAPGGPQQARGSPQQSEGFPQQQPCDERAPSLGLAASSLPKTRAGYLVTQSCPTLVTPWTVGASVHGDSPSKDTGVGCHALLQRPKTQATVNSTSPREGRSLLCASECLHLVGEQGIAHAPHLPPHRETGESPAPSQLRPDCRGHSVPPDVGGCLVS